MFCKCAFCAKSKPTENGGWKCPTATCTMNSYEMERILKLLAGTRTI